MSSISFQECIMLHRKCNGKFSAESLEKVNKSELKLNVVSSQAKTLERRVMGRTRIGEGGGGLNLRITLPCTEQNCSFLPSTTVSSRLSPHHSFNKSNSFSVAFVLTKRKPNDHNYIQVYNPAKIVLPFVCIFFAFVQFSHSEQISTGKIIKKLIGDDSDITKGRNKQYLILAGISSFNTNHFYNRPTLKEWICRDSELQSTKLLINVLKK